MKNLQEFEDGFCFTQLHLDEEADVLIVTIMEQIEAVFDFTQISVVDQDIK